MEKIRVLFVCIHNSARSQMAEAFLNNIAGDRFKAESAGIEPGVLNPLVVKSMSQAGIDISKNQTKDVFTYHKEGRKYDYVITVCDAASGERCPVFPGAHNQINWSFEDPSALQGTEKEKLKRIAVIRDEIKNKINEFLKNF